jgi:5-methylcytosine-specific restriction endonuclease McrA
MATSRTGTGTWKSIRRRAIKRAQSEGLTHCPLCSRPLDYTNPYRPESAEVDHIIEHSRGGEDNINNTRVICRNCNGKRRSREANARLARHTRTTFPPSRTW